MKTKPDLDLTQPQIYIMSAVPAAQPLRWMYSELGRQCRLMLMLFHGQLYAALSRIKHRTRTKV